MLLTDNTPSDIVPCDLETNEERTNATLLVAPLSVVDGWRMQIEKHVDPSVEFSFWFYHGSNRKGKTKKELGKMNLVMTTYATLAQPGCELLKIKWR